MPRQNRLSNQDEKSMSLAIKFAHENSPRKITPASVLRLFYPFGGSLFRFLVHPGLLTGPREVDFIVDNLVYKISSKGK
jgi:hypothetical protein